RDNCSKTQSFVFRRKEFISRREVIKLSFMTLVNKSAIITGGTRGIGFAIAEKIVANGGSVFICGRSRTRVRDAISLLSASGRAD
ncbi:SDR family NAD(P)-dependent oxidoreductase, partial [Escherichia coli]|nr:SDR family NAD(P)-dependent oxidoreductase [Escherichia coli]